MRQIEQRRIGLEKPLVATVNRNKGNLGEVRQHTPLTRQHGLLIILSFFPHLPPHTHSRLLALFSDHYP